MRNRLLLLFLFLCETAAYSFSAPKEWGALSLKNANCCPRLVYSKNLPSVDLPLPEALGIGTQKGGSSTLAHHIARHPNYTSPVRKELHFFDKATPPSDVRTYQRYWHGRGNVTSIRFEFTPNYLWIPGAACRIKSLLPDMKFLVILRDPVLRAFSEFNMIRTQCLERSTLVCGWRTSDFLDYATRGIENLKERECTFNTGRGVKTWNDCFQCLLFDEAFRTECEFRPYYFDLEKKRTCFDFGGQIVSRGLYAAQLAWWFDLFDPQNFLVINSHEYFLDPLKELAKVNEFFGVKKRFEKWMTYETKMKGNYQTFEDPLKDAAFTMLRDFYEVPNQELYALLDEVELGPFTPFGTPLAVEPAAENTPAMESASEPVVLLRDSPSADSSSQTVATVSEVERGENTGTAHKASPQQDTSRDSGPAESTDESGGKPGELRREWNGAVKTVMPAAEPKIAMGTASPAAADQLSANRETEDQSTEASEESTEPLMVIVESEIGYRRMPNDEKEWDGAGSLGKGWYFALAMFMLLIAAWLLRSAR